MANPFSDGMRKSQQTRLFRLWKGQKIPDIAGSNILDMVGIKTISKIQATAKRYVFHTNAVKGRETFCYICLSKELLTIIVLSKKRLA